MVKTDKVGVETIVMTNSRRVKFHGQGTRTSRRVTELVGATQFRGEFKELSASVCASTRKGSPRNITNGCVSFLRVGKMGWR